MKREIYEAFDSTDTRPVIMHRVANGIAEYRNPLSADMAASKLRTASRALQQAGEEVNRLRQQVSELETLLRSKQLAIDCLQGVD